uniref:Golgin-45 n=1 Tax=Onchocerca volvulus TaxID=6282 RepID=A0A8R1Y0W2_ONCVO
MEEKVRIKKRNVPRIVPWEPYKAATSAYAKGTYPGVLPPLVKYQFVKPNSIVSENKTKLVLNEKRFSENLDSGKIKICDLSRVRPVGDGKESSPLISGSIEIGKEGNTGNVKELERLKKDLKLERQLTEELKRLLVATMGDDLTCHVKSLSEDKVRLADMMTKFEAQVSHDHDKVEDLAISVDMWRCKFLAMSIRADEMRSQRCRLLAYCKQLQTLLNKFLVANQDQIHRELTSPVLEALINEAHTALRTDLSTFFERSPCDEKIYKPIPHTSNITVTCCKHCIGKEIKLI